jgi:hypothetical protein
LESISAPLAFAGVRFGGKVVVSKPPFWTKFAACAPALSNGARASDPRAAVTSKAFLMVNPLLSSPLKFAALHIYVPLIEQSINNF